ncbi:hypothetical protein HYH03_002264 [Edaphochlamys debaryana]|uniref:Uncharacterized protein n=1 Tax=Edaphochlamys debaryana TaxID=47281 RepID=A0A835YCA4_9CHLO|nr:hypothetical protein HYH03_002264 [Edaphochlamys debaryana]|eukprot:KAG2499981.1 hypothetical protein HYH03_002264 [Edaphochlamys debaryana]
MWVERQPDRGLSPSFIIGLVLLLFILTGDFGSFGGSSNNQSGQQVRLGQTPQVQAQEVREKLLYEMTLANERLEKENRHLQQQVMLLRRLYRACRGGNSTAAGASTGELAKMAAAEAALASAGEQGAAAGAAGSSQQAQQQAAGQQAQAQGQTQTQGQGQQQGQAQGQVVQQQQQQQQGATVAAGGGTGGT